MTKRESLNGRPYAGTPHVRFDEGKVASCTAEALLRRVHCRRQPEGRASVCAATSRRGSLLYKAHVKFWIIVLTGLAGISVNAAWTYDKEAGTLTDGVWTLHATLAASSSENLNVNGAQGEFNGESDKVYPIDLTEIYDNNGNRYYAVSYKAFSSHSGKYNQKTQKGSALYESIERLSAFIAPKCKTVSENGCFKNCKNLVKVHLDDEVSFSDDRPFSGCSMLNDFTPRKLMVTSLKTEFFSGCSSLAGEINLPQCTTIGSKAFSGCKLLEKVVIPKVTSINNSAFSSCSDLKEVETSTSLTVIGSAVFSGCSSLRGDCVRTLLHKGITRLGNSNSDIKDIFQNCTSFNGALIWDFPNITVYSKNGVDYPINMVGAGFFSGCSQLESVHFKTPVFEIRDGAFAEIAPGAEVYLHKDVVSEYYPSAISRKTAPFPKIVLPDTEEAWLAVIGVNNFVLERKDFNNFSWEKTIDPNASTKTGYWSDIVRMMMMDEEMCGKETIDGRDCPVPRDKRIIAFVYFTSTSNPGCGCWVLRAPLEKKGFRFILR